MTNLRILLASILLITATAIPIQATSQPGNIYNGTIQLTYHNVTVFAPAVAQTDNGQEEGVISTITVTIQTNGTGRVFVDTLPLTDVDMQGSARLAVKVASALVRGDNRTHQNPDTTDYFFVVRTSAPTIGGPSAGAIMTIATIALLENWTLDNHTVMTGMINPDGSIGPIGGIPYKIDAAHSVGATRFLIPKGQMTYTELIQETVTGNGWTQIVTHPIARNVSDYAQQHYGMEVDEVETINDALHYFTGWQFPPTTSDNPITTQDYQNAMRPIATQLLNQTQTTYQNASHTFNTTTTIPNRWPDYTRNTITDYLNYAQDALNNATNWYTNKSYYTVMSKAFQSLVDATTVQNACTYYQTTDQNTYLTTLTTQTQHYLQNQTTILNNKTITGLISLQCIGAAQQRATEATTYLNAANTSRTQGDILTAIYDLAFAHQRTDSIHWWLTIQASFNDTGTINQTDINTMAEDYIDNAQQAIAYSQILLQEMGQTSPLLTEAQNDLTTAQQENTDNHSAAALFASFEALTKANLAIELVDGLTTAKLTRAQHNANAHITQSRNRGIEPVLAVSYYEYAQSLQNESQNNSAIIYYKYSDLIAGALQLTTPTTTQTSRYIGIPPTTTQPWTPLPATIQFYAITTVIGLLAGLGIGLLLGVLLQSKQRPPQTTTQQPTTQPPTTPPPPHDTTTLPKSINDYYTKNK
jgi:uncharacterized protein